jgi:putative peptide zinc metalloprotease protein
MSQPSSTVEIANVAPTLRTDLRFVLQSHGGQTCYLIEDPTSSKFYRIGIPEYTFISLLDGTTSVRDAVAYTASLLGSEAFTERDAASICKWLVDAQLAYTEASGEYDRLLASAQSSARSKRMQKFNPLLLRLPLLRPDRVVNAATQLFGWWFSGPAFALWVGTITLALHQVVTNWANVAHSSVQIFADGNLLRLLLTWTLLKVVHEFSHAIACKKFGGHVREAGLLFILLAPIPYVDVTSSWRFSSKWRRILVSAAGMYTEIFCAAVAAIVWVNTPPGVLHQQAYNIVVTASFVTLLFNANPLMRFDGYYMFSDFLEIPNLYSLGQQYTRYVARRHMMGVSARMPTLPWKKNAAIRMYGVAALVWRVLVCASLILAASCLFAGAGIVLAIAATALWLGVPVYKLGRYLLAGNEIEKPNRLRFAVSAAVLLAAATAFVLIPEPGGIRSPAIVQYEPLHIVRAPFAGFVLEVKNRSGASVAQGAPIVVMENRSLTSEIAEMRAEGRQSEQRSRNYRKEGDVAALQVESEVRDVLLQKVTERQKQLNESVILAPAGGIVVTRDVDALLGRYVEEGQELLAIGVDQQKELQVSVSQDDIETFSQQSGQTVDVLLLAPGSSAFSSTLGTVDPRATRYLPHPALAAVNDGPLAVQESEAMGAENKWKLVEPRFLAKVPLSGVHSASLMAGQRGIVRLRTARGNLGQFIHRKVSDWVDRRLAQLR